MRYWTIVTPDYNILGEEYSKWETLSDQQILDEYWKYWNAKMNAEGPNDSATVENCITDWCIIHWAERNYFRERMDNAL